MEKTLLQIQLAKRMRDMGHTMKSLSKAAGKNETYVRDILEGRVKNPSYANLKSIADQLECSVDDLTEQGMRDRGNTGFSGFSRKTDNKVISPEMLVNATLIVKKIAEKSKLKLDKKEITDLATQACNMASEHGKGVVTDNLVKYLLEIKKHV